MNVIIPAMNMVMNSSKLSWLSTRLVSLTLLGASLMTGCVDDEEDLCPGVEWDNCDVAVEACLCHWYDPGSSSPTGEGPSEGTERRDITNVCSGTEYDECVFACASVGGTIYWEAETFACNNSTGASTSCTGWNPGSYISASGSTRTIQAGLLTGLDSYPAPLYACDTARIQYSSGTGYVVKNPSTDDAVYLLGLRNNDELVSVNGYPITTVVELAYAYFVLWVTNGITTYTVVVDRGGTPTTFTWYVSWTL